MPVGKKPTYLRINKQKKEKKRGKKCEKTEKKREIGKNDKDGHKRRVASLHATSLAIDSEAT